MNEKLLFINITKTLIKVKIILLIVKDNNKINACWI